MAAAHCWIRPISKCAANNRSTSCTMSAYSSCACSRCTRTQPLCQPCQSLGSAESYAGSLQSAGIVGYIRIFSHVSRVSPLSASGSCVHVIESLRLVRLSLRLAWACAASVCGERVRSVCVICERNSIVSKYAWLQSVSLLWYKLYF